jgi:hypothetical protein
MAKIAKGTIVENAVGAVENEQRMGNDAHLELIDALEFL